MKGGGFSAPETTEKKNHQPLPQASKSCVSKLRRKKVLPKPRTLKNTRRCVGKIGLENQLEEGIK